MESSLSTALGHEVRQQVAGRLAADGWALLDQGPFDPPGVGTLALPLADGFAATALVECLPGFPDEGPAGVAWESAVAILGLDYGPARELTVATTGRAYSGIALREPTRVVALPDEDAVVGAVDQLVTFAVEQAHALTRLADLDVLIEMLGDGRAASSGDALWRLLHGEDELQSPPGAPALTDRRSALVPSLLAAAGRFDDARAALAHYHTPRWDRLATDAERRLARQLSRWIDAEGKLALPCTPAQWPSELGRRWLKTELPSFREAMAQADPSARAKQEARKAVQAVSAGKTRDELRALLHEELRQRGVAEEPVALEMSIHALITEREPFGKARLFASAAKALWDLGQSGHVEVTSERPHGDEEEPVPAWLKRPEHAAYPVLRVTGRKVAVALDASATPFLQRVMGAGNGALWDSRDLEIWLADARPRLSVYVGNERVGGLDEDTSEDFRGVISAASERDEAPWMTARLVRVPGEPPLLLELTTPEAEE